MKRLFAASVCALLLASLTSHAEAAPAEIQVRNNVFAPADVRVEPGQRLTWTVGEGKHTVTSDVGKRFDSGVMERPGQTFSFVAPRTDVTIYYHCRIHGIRGEGSRWGSGMVGRIVVGNGSPAPRSADVTDVRRVPSKRWPTLGASLTSLQPDGRYRIDLAPGTYRPFDLTRARLGFKEAPDPRFELTIRGAGRRPTDVVFQGAESLGLSVDGARIENVSFRKQRFAAVFAKALDRWSIDDVVISKGASHGIWVEDAYHGRIRRVSIAGATVAGISVRRCVDCDLLVDSVNVEESLQGLSAVGAGSLVVRGSVFRNNGVGVALKGSPAEGQLHRGAHVMVNTFRNNTNRRLEAPAPTIDKELPVGAGVWIDGGAFDVVERNDFDGHSFGVAVTGPSHSSRIEDNTMTRSHEADVAWSGLGADVCFSRNTSPTGEAASSMPIVAKDIYACGLLTTIGIPYPLVDATLLAWGSRAA